MLAVVVAALLPVTVAPARAADPDRRIVYLTFDDGPSSLYSPRLLKILSRHRVPATFFVVGRSLSADPGYATRLWLGGHAVGNHTWSHPDLTGLDPLGVRRQVLSTQRLAGRAAGMCVRPPYGAHNAVVDSVIEGLGMSRVMWTVDPQDWRYQDAQRITSHVVQRVENKSVILLHDGGGPRAQTLAAVEALIPRLLLRGYEFRTVPKCRRPLGGVVEGAARTVRDPGSRQQPKPPVTPPPVTPQPSAPVEPPAPGGNTAS
jgi:peptidoglycan/xylan/chitin deacetylase (PgdA/CDA1 family)